MDRHTILYKEVTKSNRKEIGVALTDRHTILYKEVTKSNRREIGVALTDHRTILYKDVIKRKEKKLGFMRHWGKAIAGEMIEAAEETHLKEETKKLR